MDRGDYTAAEQMLQTMKTAAPGSFSRNNYDYLLARLLEWRKEHVQALALFKEVVARNSPLASYALWHQAEISRAPSKNPRRNGQMSRLVCCSSASR